MGGRKWTPEEIEYLRENYGTKSFKSLAKNLKRSKYSIRNKRNELGLGAFLENGSYVTFNQVHRALTGKDYNTTIEERWMKRGFPVWRKFVFSRSIKVVYIHDFWKWAEKNQDILDFSKFEPLSLGIEPKWVAEKRKRDTVSKTRLRKAWTPDEDERVSYMVWRGESIEEIAKELNRSEDSVRCRLYRIGIKVRDRREKWEEKH